MRVSGMEREYRKIRKTIDHMITAQYTELDTTPFALIMITLCVVLTILAMVFDSSLPVALSENDIGENTQRFIGKRAFENVKDLSNIGPRAVGSYENEYKTVQYLWCEIERIKNISPTTWNEIDLNFQVVSGCFDSGTFGKQTCYQNIQNIVAMLRSKSNVTESILVNCHFDSVFSSPGTSDDGLNCAVMLEVLRIMSKVDYPLKRNIVFLFNGAEEDGRSGSHGFITKHQWARDIISFINLDACGAGGRQVLFQSGPKAYVLAQIYASSVPHPSGKVISEELFQSGFLPSDTDFRNFRDYGHLKGLDLAHVKNGYVYHTKNDNITMVSENIVQLTGDNVLALVKALVEYENLAEAIYESSDDRAVYFDVFGKFVICYPWTVMFLVNTIVIFVSLYTAMYMLYYIFRGKPVKIILHHVLIDLAFVVIGILAVTLVLYLLATVLKLNDVAMLWYSNQWFVLSYYAAAVLLVMCSAIKMRQTFLYTLLNGEQEAKVFIFVIQIIMTIILLFGTISGIRSSFVLAIGLIGVSISHYFMNKTRLRLEIVEHKFLTYTAINFLPALYCAYVFIPYFQIIIPMLGRKGADFDAETAIWVMTFIAVFVTLAYFIPLVLLVKDFWIMQYVFLVIFLLQFFYVLSATVWPFSDTSPQRYVALHVNRKLTNSCGSLVKIENSGYLVIPNDFLGGDNLLMLFKEERFQQLENVDDTCTRELFCGMPSFYAKLVKSQHLSFWAPKDKPILPEKEITHRLIDYEYDYRTYKLSLKGSKFMDVIILPLNNAKLVQWSFDPSTPSRELQWNGQPVYFIRFHEGSVQQYNWLFWLKFDVRDMRIKNDCVFKLAWSVFHPSNSTDHYTSQFRNFIDEFPSWTNVISMVVDHEEYLIP